MSFLWLLLLVGGLICLAAILVRRRRVHVPVPAVSPFVAIGRDGAMLSTSQLPDSGDRHAGQLVQGPIESGEWTFTCGIRFTEQQLGTDSLRRWLGARAEFFNRSAEDIKSFEGINATRNGYMVCDDGSKMYQFITFRATWITERSFAANSTTSGSCYRLSSIRGDLFALESELFAAHRGTRFAGSVLNIFRLELASARQDAGNSTTFTIPIYEKQFPSIRVEETIRGDADIHPIYSWRADMPSDWFFNDGSSDHCMKAKLAEFGDGESI